jgi:uncharacterized protein (TIGR02594 family)
MLPAAYAWLSQSLAQNDGHPKMVAVALAEYGTQEIHDAEKILGWRDEIANISPAKRAGMVGYATDIGAPHRIPWCGLYAAHLAHQASYEFPDFPLWAANWAGFGEKSPLPSLGDVLVFRRPGGSHVGLYVAEDAEAFHVLGGNEADQVKIVRELKQRLVACRRPPYTLMPANVKPYHVAAAGALSTNEA